MKKIYFLLICLTIMAIACGTQLPSVTSTEVKQPTYEAQPVQLAEIVEPTESPIIYVTTAPLNVRSEANASSTILGTLEAGTVVTVFILDIRGDDCYMGEWLAIDKPIAGFVCSLYIEER